MRLIEEPLSSPARHRRNLAVRSCDRLEIAFAVDSSNNVVLHPDDEHVAVAVEVNFVRLIQFCTSRAAIAVITVRPLPATVVICPVFGTEPANSMISHFADGAARFGPTSTPNGSPMFNVGRSPGVAIILRLPVPATQSIDAF